MTVKDLYSQGSNFEREGNYEKAIEAYNETLALEPDHKGARSGIKRIARSHNAKSKRDNYKGEEFDFICQICGKESGSKPICKIHHEMSENGEVSDCNTCRTWHITSLGCSTCSKKSPGQTSTGSLTAFDSDMTVFERNAMMIEQAGIQRRNEERYALEQTLSKKFENKAGKCNTCHKETRVYKIGWRNWICVDCFIMNHT